jgi:hypothetical protein
MTITRLFLGCAVATGLASAAPTPTAPNQPPKPTRLRLRDVVAAAHTCAGKPAIELATIRAVSATAWSVDFRDHRKKRRFTVDAVTGACNSKIVTRNVKLKAIAKMPDVDLDAAFAEGDRCVKLEVARDPTFIARSPELHVGPDFVSLVFDRNDRKLDGLIGPLTLDVESVGTCAWVPGE